MIDNTSKSIRRFVRLADDMGMNKGDVGYGNRGLTWHRYNPGAFSRLPQGLSNVLESQVNAFKNSYSDFAINPKTGKPYTDFRGMLFTIYAEDRAITPDIDRQVPPELRAAADLVKNNEIKLPPMDENPTKAIGGPQWISQYAYAWRSQYPQDVTFSEDRSSPRAILQVSSDAHRQYEHGILAMAPTGQGFGLFINTNKGNKIPIYIGQSAAGLSKYFKDSISPNQSMVAMPNGPRGEVSPARRTKNPLQRNNKFKPEHLYRFKILDDGTIGAEKEDQFFPFNEQQISSLVDRLGSEWYIRPAKEIDGITSDMGPWRMSDRLKNELSQPNIPNGFEAIRGLRSWLEQIKPGFHTPLEGFKIITIGPMFSSSLSLGEGKTIGHSNFVTDLTKSRPGEVSPNTYQEVIRGVKWVVIANEYSEKRMQANGISSIRPSARVQGDAERSPAYDNPAQAISYVKAKYLGDAGNANKVLSEMSDSVLRAEQALKAAAAGSNIPKSTSLPMETKKPQIAPPSQQVSKTPIPSTPSGQKPRIRLEYPPSGQNNTTASLKRWISKHTTG